MRSAVCRRKATVMSVLIATVVLTAIAAFGVVASDTGAPSWRGSLGATYQEWLFNTNCRPAVPELVSNPFCTPSAQIDYRPPYGTGWKDSLPGVYGSAQGWWDIASGSIALSINSQSSVSPGTAKDIQVQVVYWQDISQSPSVVVTPTASLLSKTTALVTSGPVGGGWYRDLWRLRVNASQGSEVITVNGDPIMGSMVDRIVVDTGYTSILDSAAKARMLPEGTACELLGPVVTRSFGSFFYVENSNRLAGIRVNCAAGQAAAAEGTAPRVVGVLRVVNGERVIDQAEVVTGAQTPAPRPLALTCRSVSQGLSPQGLLVRISGRAAVANSGQTWFTVSDGSPLPIKVVLHGINPPVDGSFVRVAGVIGADASGPVLHVNASQDIQVRPSGW